MFGKYNIFELLQAYKDNRFLIESYIKGESIESYKYSDMSDDGTEDNLIFGMSVGVFLIFFIFVLGLWIYALMILLKYWKNLPDWAKIIGVLGLLTGLGPVVTIVVVYVGKDQKI